MLGIARPILNRCVKLQPQAKELFEVAKDNELSCWLSTNSLKPILRQKLNPDQILRSRWVLTWKDGESVDGKPAQKRAKARLVVLGYMDPQITNVVRDSPTLSREGRHTILQCLAAYKWELTSFDIKTAFLRGKADASNPLAMEPPKELRQKMNLADQLSVAWQATPMAEWTPHCCFKRS